MVVRFLVLGHEWPISSTFLKRASLGPFSKLAGLGTISPFSKRANLGTLSIFASAGDPTAKQKRETLIFSVTYEICPRRRLPQQKILTC